MDPAKPRQMLGLVATFMPEDAPFLYQNALRVFPRHTPYFAFC
jgi:hypothetical protein